MKILVVAGLYPPDIGGAEESLHAALRFLVGRGHNIRVVADERRPEKGARDGVPVFGVGEEELESKLDELAALQPPDLVLTQLIYSERALAWARAREIPAVYLLRKPGVELDLSRGSALDPALIIANSRDAAAYVKEKWGRPAGVVLPVVDRERVRPEQNSREFITMINPAVKKGGERFREIAKRLPGRRFLAVFGWTGLRGPDGAWSERQWARMARAHGLERLEPTAEAGLDDLDNVERRYGVADMKGEVYGRTRLLLFPSLWREPFGRAIVEAQTAGIPVLAAAVGGVPEALNGGGIVIEAPDDPGAWVKAIEGLDDERAWQAASAAAREAAAGYDPEREAAELEMLLREVVRRFGSGR